MDGTGGGVLLSVRGQPRAIWRRLVRRVDEHYSDEEVAKSDCRPDANDDGQIVSCDLIVRGRRRDGQRELFTARLWTVRDDVSGGYLMRIDRRPAYSGFLPGSSTLHDANPNFLPAPSRRTPPKPGEPLSPLREPQRYTLLAGSELVAVYGAGTVTGGFDALMRVQPGRDLDAMARAYARQAAEGPGPIRKGLTKGRTTYTPPGGAGGYQGIITLIDQPGDQRDLIMYELFND